MIRTQPFTAVFVLIALSLVSIDAAHADYKRDYTDGLKAFYDSKWQQAITLMEKAKSQTPASAQRIRLYGMRFEPYLPYYHLGQAYFELGDCTQAVDYWKQALNQGVVQNLSKEYKTLQSGNASCGPQQPQIDYDALVTDASKALDQLDRSVGRLNSLSNSPIIKSNWAQTPWNQTLIDGTRTATDLRANLAQSARNKDAKAIESVTTNAKSSARKIRNAVEAAGARLTELEREQNKQRSLAERNQATNDLNQAVAAASALEKAQIQDQDLITLGNELDSLIQSGRNPAGNASVAQLRQLTRNLNNKTRGYRLALENAKNKELEIAFRTPPAELLRVAQAYFDGNYTQAAQLSKPENFDTDRTRIQAHLFRAAAQYNLYLLSNQPQASLLDRVQRDIRLIKQIDQQFSPYLDAFSPKFLSLFEKTR